MNGTLGKENAAEIRADLGAMDDKHYVQVFQGRRAGAEYLHGILPAAKEYLQQLEHRRFAGCKNDYTCFQGTPPSLVEVCVSSILSVTSKIAGSWEVVKASKVFVKERAAVVSRRTVDIWTVLPEKFLYRYSCANNLFP